MKSNIGRFFVLSGFIVFYVAFFLDTFKDGDNFYKFEAVMIIVYPFLLLAFIFPFLDSILHILIFILEHSNFLLFFLSFIITTGKMNLIIILIY